jgi:hypothetical protein
MKHTANTASLPTHGINPAFLCYLPHHIGELNLFQKAIATLAVGRAIVLAATGMRGISITMPTLHDNPRCIVTLPRGGYFCGGLSVMDIDQHPEKFLEYICYQIGGAVALFALDKDDYYGEIGLNDIEGTFADLATFEAAHKVNEGNVLAGCTVVTERILGRNSEVAEEMIDHLLERGRLCCEDMHAFLSRVHREEIGGQVLATFEEPWIGDEADRVRRMFIGC